MSRNQGRNIKVLWRDAFVAFGSNLPDATTGPEALVQRALRLLEGDSVRVAVQSRMYRSPAFPAGSGPDYINGVVKLQTSLGAADLLARLHRIEALMGRQRRARWAARSLDLDLLSYQSLIAPDPDTYEYWRGLPLAEQMVQAPDRLILPHPRLQDRAFVLVPLVEIAPEWQHPVLKLSATALLARVPKADRRAVSPL